MTLLVQDETTTTCIVVSGSGKLRSKFLIANETFIITRMSALRIISAGWLNVNILSLNIKTD